MRFLYRMDVTISLRNLPHDVEAAILQKSKQLGISLSKAAEQLIQAGLQRPERNSDFDEFCGLWADGQGRELQERVQAMRRVDGADWAQ
jgi:hypothetical protein